VVDVNVVYWLRLLGERRRQLAWWSARKRIVRDLVGGASVPRDLLPGPNRRDLSASGTTRPPTVSKS